MRALICAVCVGCAGAGDEHVLPGGAVLADTWVTAPGHDGTGTHDAELAVNGVRCSGQEAGSTDVFSLGYEPGVDDALVLAWSRGPFFDGPGPELAVFENAFQIGGGPERFMDPVVVEVSADGEAWVAWAHAYGAADPATYSTDAADWTGFAGLTPCELHVDERPLDPFGPDAGGDAFDLADLPSDDPATKAVWADGAAYVRLSSAVVWTDPTTGLPFPRDPVSDGADIDGIAATGFADPP